MDKGSGTDMERRYFGITGFKRRAEVGLAGKLLDAAGFAQKDCDVMFGLLCSEKRLAEPDTAGARSPALRDLPVLAYNVPSYGFAAVHYHSKNTGRLADDLREVFAVGKMYEEGLCTAVQLNAVWPDVAQVARVRAQMPALKVILQIPRRALAGGSAADIARRAGEYEGLVRYVLVDPSGGEGKILDVEQGSDVLCALSETMPTTRLGIAGGLDGENVKEIVARLNARLRHYARAKGDAHSPASRYAISIDAEGRLRHECDRYNGFDAERLAAYIDGGAKVF